MSIQIDLDSLKKSIDKTTANSMFPGLANSNDELFNKIDVTPETGFSDEAVIIDYNVNYTVAATNQSAFDTVIELLRQGIGLQSQDSLNSILNAVDLTKTALSKITGVETANGMQKINFKAFPRPKPGVRECYQVEMKVFGGSLVSDITDKTVTDELSKLTTTLDVPGIGSKVLSKQNAEKSVTRVNFNYPTTVGPKHKKDKIKITAFLNQECRTDGDLNDFFISIASIALIHISLIRFTVSVIPCPEDEKPKVEPKKEKDEQPKKEEGDQPKSEKTEDKNKKRGLKTIDGIGAAKEKLLNNAGVNSILELANFEGDEIDGISKTELTTYLISAAKVLTSFDKDQAEFLVKEFNAKKFADIIEVANKFDRVEDLIVVIEASKVKMPASFSPEIFFLKLKAII
ncbi:MAG: hypothetical protein ACI8ZM_000638 [Crocinitomix sp.]|jgi:hypothetical protein